MKKLSGFLAAVLFLMSASVLSACTDEKPVKGDLKFSLADDGRIDSIMVRDLEILNTEGAAGGFYIYDYDSNMEYALSSKSVSKKGSVYTQTLGNDELNTELTAVYETKDGKVVVNFNVKNNASEDRRFGIRYKIPVDADGWNWGKDLENNPVIEGDNKYRELTVFSGKIFMSEYPFCSISKGDAGFGISTMWDSPVVYNYQYDNSEKILTTEFYAALSSLSKTPMEAEFTFMMFDFDGEWGFRGALDRIYKYLPERFETKVEDHGNWIFQQVYNDVPAIEDFNFKYNETPLTPKVDNENGIDAMIYVAPCEIWLPWYERDDPNMPTEAELIERLNYVLSLDESVASIDGYAPLPQVHVAQAIVNSAFKYANGSYYTAGWNNEYNKIVCFVTNGDPDIPGMTSYTLHRDLLRAKEEEIKKSGGNATGIYIDNVNIGSGLFNYATEQYKYADYPLLWDTTGKIALPYSYSVYEFTKQFKEIADGEGKMTLGNIAFPETSALMCANLLDVPGGEIGNSWGNTDKDYFMRRVAAGQKPWTLLLTQQFNNAIDGFVDYNDIDLSSREQLMKKAMYFGVHANILTLGPTSGTYEELRPIFVKYSEAVKTISEAGWEPITLARSTDSTKILAERYGSADNAFMYFTLRSLVSGAESEGITVDLADIKGIKSSDYGNVAAYDMIQRKFLETTVENGVLTVKSGLKHGDDYTAIVIGTKTGIIKSFGGIFEDYGQRFVKSADALVDKYGKGGVSEDAAVVSVADSLKKAASDFRDAAKKQDLSKMRESLGSINSLTKQILDSSKMGKIDQNKYTLELLNTSDRVLNGYLSEF